jgi:putative transposase
VRRYCLAVLIISMYARGMTTRDIQGHLQEVYGIDVSPALIFQVTDAISEEVLLWQNRTLDEICPIVYLDPIRIRSRHDSRVIYKAVSLAIGINMEGIKEVLGMWISETWDQA